MQSSCSKCVFGLVCTIFLMLTTSCSSSRYGLKEAPQVIKTVSIPKRDVAISPIIYMPNLLASVKTINAKANIDINIQGNEQSAKSQIRWIRDSVIWMNFTLYGIEGARLLVTKDSFFLIDRINKRFISESMLDMAKKYQLPISFVNLQNIILGDPVLISKTEISEEKKSEFIHFVQQDSLWRADYYTDTTALKLTKMNLRQKKSSHLLVQELKDFIDIKAARNFSKNRVIEFVTDKTGKAKLNLEMKDISVNTSKEIKFSIPSSYERM